MADPIQIDPNALVAALQQPQQQTGILGGAEKLLGNPLVQGALAGYLGSLTGGRGTTMLGRIGEGGLTGLQAYSNARQLQTRLPLQQAQLMAALGKVPLEAAQTQAQQARVPLMQAQARQVGGDPAANMQNATTFMQLAMSEQNPARRQVLQGMSGEIGNGTLKLSDAYTKLSKYDEDVAKIGVEGAQKALAEGKVAQLPAETKRIEAQTRAATASAQKSLAETAHVGDPKGSNFETMIDPTTGKPIHVDKTKPITTNAIPVSTWNKIQGDANSLKKAAEWQKAYQAGLKEFHTTNPSHLMGFVGPSETDADTYARQKADEHLAMFTGEGAGGTSALPPHATTGEGLPSGSKPNGDGSWKLPDGTTVWPK